MLIQILLLALIVGPFIAWELGTRNPKQTVREKIEDEITHKVISWYEKVQWECIDIIHEPASELFPPLRIAILKNGAEQIKICDSEGIIKGSLLTLEARKGNKRGNGPRSGVVDEMMKAVTCS